MPLSAWLAASLILNQGGIKTPQPQKAENEAKTIAAFEHTAGKLNTSSNFTTLDNPALNGKADAILLVTRVGTFAEAPAAVGVWFNNGKWTIYRQDRKPMPLGEKFVVEAFEPGPYAFIVTSQGDRGHLCPVPSQNLPNVKGKGLFVTSAFTSTGVYNTHALGTWHDKSQWQIFQSDRQPIAKGASFHVVYGRAEQVGVPNDVLGGFFDVDRPWLTRQPEVLVTVTNTFDDTKAAYVPFPVSASYLESSWRLAGSFSDLMPAGASFFMRSSGRRPLRAVQVASAELNKPDTFRISLLGFNCLSATADTIVETDGKGDEIYAAISLAVRKDDAIENLTFYRSNTFGDTNGPLGPNRIQAGSMSDKGGIQTGDSYINPGPNQPGGRNPMVIMERKLPEGQTLCIVPSFFEQDHTNEQRNFLYFRSSKPASSAISQWMTNGEKPYTIFLPFLSNHTFLPPAYPDIPIGAGDWSIGRAYSPEKVNTYASTFPALFYSGAELGAMADGPGPHGNGTFKVRLGVPHSTSFGAYEMILKVERVVGRG